MANRIAGYDGGDSEEALLKALREAVATEVSDAWDKIETKYMYIGSIIETAIARGYVKQSRLGFAGYFLTTIGYAEKSCRDYLRCWEKRHDFYPVKQWVKTNNSYKPPKASGPLLFLDAHKAWLNRNKPHQIPAQQKKLTLRQARRLIHAYQDMLDRSGGVIVKWADEDGRDTREWNVIVQERAMLEAEMSENTGEPTPLPVVATRDDEGDEQDQPEEDGDQGTVQEQTGTAFHIAEPVVPPPRHPPRPTRPVLALPPPDGDASGIDATEVLKELAATQKLPVEIPDVGKANVKAVVVTPTTPIKLDVALDAAAVAVTEKKWNLKWQGGAKASDDSLLRSKRASFFGLHPNTDEADRVWLNQQKRDFWRGIRDDAAVLAALKTKQRVTVTEEPETDEEVSNGKTT